MHFFHTQKAHDNPRKTHTIHKAAMPHDGTGNQHKHSVRWNPKSMNVIILILRLRLDRPTAHKSLILSVLCKIWRAFAALLLDKHSLWMWWWSLMNLCPDWSTTCPGMAVVLSEGSGVVLEVGADAAGRLLPVIVSRV